MTKEDYIELVKLQKLQIKKHTDRLEALKSEYINANMPYPIGTMVEVERESGRKTTGAIHAYGILQDKQVYVTAIKPTKGNIVYISVPYKSIKTV